MKTLDNVIEAMERCSIPHYFDCKGCPYEDDDAEVGCRSDDRDADALHYLKAFRDAKDTLEREKDRYAEAIKNCERAENIYKQKQKAAEDALWICKEDKDDLTALRAYWAEQQANPALTWDELHQMDGKPVWATFDNENGTWYIAKVYDDEVVLYEWGQEFGERISGAWDYTPKRWQAYKKERADGQQD